MNLDPTMLTQIARVWNATRALRDDSQRKPDTLAHLLKSQQVDWYRGPGGSIWYLTQRDDAEQSAVIHVLNENPMAWKHRLEILDMFGTIMDGRNLRKLYALIPGPTKQIKRLAAFLGFKHEGTLRESCKFDGKFTNLEVFGILRREIGRERKRAKAARKSRELDRGRRAEATPSFATPQVAEARA